MMDDEFQFVSMGVQASVFQLLPQFTQGRVSIVKEAMKNLRAHAIMTL